MLPPPDGVPLARARPRAAAPRARVPRAPPAPAPWPRAPGLLRTRLADPLLPLALLLGDDRVDLVGQVLARLRRLRDRGLEGRPVLRELVVLGALRGQRRRRLLRRPATLSRAALSSPSWTSSSTLRSAISSRRTSMSALVPWTSCWIADSSRMSSTISLRERLVLDADVEQVAHLAQRVRERIRGEHRFEQRHPVGGVGLPDPLGEQRLALDRALPGAAAPRPGGRRAGGRSPRAGRRGCRSSPGPARRSPRAVSTSACTSARFALIPLSFFFALAIAALARCWAALTWATWARCARIFAAIALRWATASSRSSAVADGSPSVPASSGISSRNGRTRRARRRSSGSRSPST